MVIPNTTQDVLDSLTPTEMKVLRNRFGLNDEEIDKNINGDIPPPVSGGDDSGGAPASPN